jgi:hypothetical protein
MKRTHTPEAVTIGRYRADIRHYLNALNGLTGVHKGRRSKPQGIARLLGNPYRSRLLTDQGYGYLILVCGQIEAAAAEQRSKWTRQR